MRSIRNFFITFGISLIVFGLIAWLIWMKLGIEDTNTVNPPVYSDNSQDEDSGNITEAEKEEVVGDSFTAVLCCYDDSLGRADAIVMVNVDKKTEKFSLCPIPSYLKIDIGTDTVKKEVYLGDLLASKGRNYFLQKLEAITGLSVDYYAFLSSSDFVNIINEIGGIEYNVPMNMYYQSPDGVELVNLVAGKTRLMGENALELVRFRSYPATQGVTDDGDAKRRQTQCDFLYTVLGTFLKPQNKEHIDNIVKTLLELVADGDTNFTLTAFLRHKDTVLEFENYTQEIIEYPVSTTKIEILSNGEKLAVHTPDINRAVEEVFNEFKNN